MKVLQQRCTIRDQKINNSLPKIKWPTLKITETRTNKGEKNTKTLKKN